MSATSIASFLLEAEHILAGTMDLETFEFNKRDFGLGFWAMWDETEKVSV
jgi:hypothetical protein